jgi:hypothetical protein
MGGFKSVLKGYKLLQRVLQHLTNFQELHVHSEALKGAISLSSKTMHVPYLLEFKMRFFPLNLVLKLIYEVVLNLYISVEPDHTKLNSSELDHADMQSQTKACITKSSCVD